MAPLNACQKPSILDARCIVIKIGSALLVDASAGLRKGWLENFALDIRDLKARGCDVVIVSSGAIALGRRILPLPAKGLSLEQSQAAAAVGQIHLCSAYEQVLGIHNITTAQVLLTLDDTQNRKRYLNSRATLETLLSLGVVPIVNENDTVATDEIRFGDNDRFAAQVAVEIGADQLVLLSDVDGLYTANPTHNPNARRLDVVERVTPAIMAMGSGAASEMSRGGMKTKLMAARIAMAGGCAMAIARGNVERPLRVLERGGNCTWFLPEETPHQARKRWIDAMKPRGELVVDEGAVVALHDGKSLLPAGVTKVSGSFKRGDLVMILSPKLVPLGKGLVRYDVSEARKIVGHRLDEVEAILGFPNRGVLVHRDDMICYREDDAPKA